MVSILTLLLIATVFLSGYAVGLREGRKSAKVVMHKPLRARRTNP